jgi:hypothetical protein
MNGRRHRGRKNFAEFPQRAKKEGQTTGPFANPVTGQAI